MATGLMLSAITCIKLDCSVRIATHFFGIIASQNTEKPHRFDLKLFSFVRRFEENRLHILLLSM